MWSVLKFWNFPGGPHELLFNEIQWNGQTLLGLIISTHSIAACVKYMLQKGSQYILTSFFNQDPLGKHFGHYIHKTGNDNNNNYQQYMKWKISWLRFEPLGHRAYHQPEETVPEMKTATHTWLTTPTFQLQGGNKKKVESMNVTVSWFQAEPKFKIFIEIVKQTCKTLLYYDHVCTLYSVQFYLLICTYFWLFKYFNSFILFEVFLFYLNHRKKNVCSNNGVFRKGNEAKIDILVQEGLGPRTAKLAMSICLKMYLVELVWKSGHSANEYLLISCL